MSKAIRNECAKNFEDIVKVSYLTKGAVKECYDIDKKYVLQIEKEPFYCFQRDLHKQRFFCSVLTSQRVQTPSLLFQREINGLKIYELEKVKGVDSQSIADKTRNERLTKNAAKYISKTHQIKGQEQDAWTKYIHHMNEALDETTTKNCKKVWTEFLGSNITKIEDQQ